MKLSKGQNAVEYMMTYGWAILIVLVVSIVIWQMGVLDLSRNVTPDKRGFSQVVPLDWSMNQDGTFSVVVQNNAGTIINGQAGTGANFLAGGDGICSVTTDLSLTDPFRPADTFTMVFDCSSAIHANTKIGDYYRVNVTIGYVNPSSGLPHLSNGLIWGPIN